MPEEGDDWPDHAVTRSWQSLGNWKPETSPARVAAAMLSHVNVHIVQLNQISLKVLYADSPQSRRSWDLYARMEAKHGIDDILAALDYWAFAIFERRYCILKSAPLPHPNDRLHKTVYFPFPLPNESKLAYITRHSKGSCGQLAKVFAPFFYSTKYRHSGHVVFIHELGIESKHRTLSVTHIGRLGYGFNGTDETLNLVLVRARRGAGKVIRETRAHL